MKVLVSPVMSDSCNHMDGRLPGSSLSMVFPRQEHQSGLPFLSPEALSDPGTQPGFTYIASRFFTF